MKKADWHERWKLLTWFVAALLQDCDMEDEEGDFSVSNTLCVVLRAAHLIEKEGVSDLVELAERIDEELEEIFE